MAKTNGSCLFCQNAKVFFQSQHFFQDKLKLPYNIGVV